MLRTFTIVLLLVICGAGVFGMLLINMGGSALYTDDTKPLTEIAKVNELVYSIRTSVRDAVLNSDNSATVTAAQEKITAADKEYRTVMKSYVDSIKNDAELTALVSDAEKLYDEAFMPMVNGSLEKAKAGKFEEARSVLVTGTEGVTKMINNLSKCQETEVESARGRVEQNQLIFVVMLVSALAITAIGFVVSIIVSKKVATNITVPIRKMVDAANELSTSTIIFPLTWTARTKPASWQTHSIR